MFLTTVSTFIIGFLASIHMLAQPYTPPQITHFPTITLQPTTVALPLSLRIAKLGINTSIEAVGLDSQDRMDVPKDPQHVGWYAPGFKPGQAGNAVIDGHLDTQTTTAIFYRLHTLTSGDRIEVLDTDGTSHIFTVYDKKIFPYDKLPLKDIFGTSTEVRLNLITCSGTFNEKEHNYTERTVIYSRASPL